MTVSERIAAHMSPAIAGEGITPYSWYMAVRIVLVEPTGSFRTATGILVWMSAKRWWSMIAMISTCSSPGTDWDASLWSTSTTRLLLGRSMW